jgi:hypothetical protein
MMCTHINNNYIFHVVLFNPEIYTLKWRWTPLCECNFCSYLIVAKLFFFFTLIEHFMVLCQSHSFTLCGIVDGLTICTKSCRCSKATIVIDWNCKDFNILHLEKVPSHTCHDLKFLIGSNKNNIMNKLNPNHEPCPIFPLILCSCI